MPECGSGGLVSSSSLLIRKQNHACRQAEIPLIALFKNPEPALCSNHKGTPFKPRHLSSAIEEEGLAPTSEVPACRRNRKQFMTILANPWMRVGVDAWSLSVEASSVIALRMLKF